MSELINTRNHKENLRRDLLTNVSVLALMGALCAPSSAWATSDEGRPTVWIELGGQIERLDTPQAIFAPPFFGSALPVVRDTLVGAQRPSRYSPGAEGKVTFAPEASNWVFSAAVRYGRVKNARHLHYQTPGLPSFINTLNNAPLPVKPELRNFGDDQTDIAESHFVADFQAGRDVGLGMFGSGGSSVVSAGVRYAQFTSSSDATIHARPVLGYNPGFRTKVGAKYQSNHRVFHQTYTALLHTNRNTHAVGPSVSWDASMPLIGSEDGMSVVFDWGVNAAVLFGRQRTHVDHQTTGYRLYYTRNVKHTAHYTHRPPGITRSRSVFIPNVGGFAGLSLKFPNAKISLGYRGDFFFNATDSGLDARDAANQNFYGPFATISIGLGG